MYFSPSNPHCQVILLKHTSSYDIFFFLKTFNGFLLNWKQNQNCYICSQHFSWSDLCLGFQSSSHFTAHQPDWFPASHSNTSSFSCLIFIFLVDSSTRKCLPSTFNLTHSPYSSDLNLNIISSDVHLT